VTEGKERPWLNSSAAFSSYRQVVIISSPRLNFSSPRDRLLRCVSEWPSLSLSDIRPVACPLSRCHRHIARIKPAHTSRKCLLRLCKCPTFARSTSSILKKLPQRIFRTSGIKIFGEMRRSHDSRRFDLFIARSASLAVTLDVSRYWYADSDPTRYNGSCIEFRELKRRSNLSEISEWNLSLLRIDFICQIQMCYEDIFNIQLNYRAWFNVSHLVTFVWFRSCHTWKQIFWSVTCVCFLLNGEIDLMWCYPVYLVERSLSKILLYRLML